MSLLLIPVVLAFLAGLLFLSESLEQRSSDAMLRMAMRSSRTTPEATELIFATELARRLELAGLGRRPVADEPTADEQPLGALTAAPS
jgi:hypothetical protein